MKQKSRKFGFSIIELLTVMSIIIVLLGILVPSLGAVRRYAKEVRQKGQFHDISKGLEMFSVDSEDYPDSSAWDFTTVTTTYCGAMKLCEAMIGQDGLGFHPDSRFAADGTDIAKNQLYFNRPPGLSDPITAAEQQNLQDRKPLYMEGEDVQIAEVNDIYPAQAEFDDDCPLLCDVFKRNQLRVGTEKAGMPILYFKADTSKLLHDYDEFNARFDGGPNIYNYWDNCLLIDYGVPWSGEDHPYKVPPPGKGEGELFYEDITDKNVITMDKPNKPDSYILISAGWDGKYGTEDDVLNFD